MSEPLWVPVSGALVEDFIPTPVDGKWLKGGPGGTMVWADLPAGGAPPGIVTPSANWVVLGTDVGFTNGWYNYGAPYGPGRFRKLASGIVVCEGLILGGSVGYTAFTFPVGYRPTPNAAGAQRDLIFQVAIGGSVSYEAARLFDTGEFRPTAGASTSWISLTGVTFYAG